MEKGPIVIGVAGGSGSGKTTVSQAICRHFPEGSIALIEQDAYYKIQDDIPFKERLKGNYDHPFAFDNELLVTHLQALRRMQSIEKPVYDYTAYTRSDKMVAIEPRDVILVEGVLVLEDERLRNLMDIKLYVDTDSDLRVIRRLERDIVERERSMASVIEQYIKVVRPMHRQFVEPTKRYADVIIPEGGRNSVAIDLIVAKIRMVLEARGSASDETD
ncbi:MAG: uridine kinase [Sporolactobacillus sp.]